MSDLVITFLGDAAHVRQAVPGSGYLGKDFGDKAIEDVQTTADPLLKDKLGAIRFVGPIPAAERGPVKFAIAQYFKSQSPTDPAKQGTRDAEVDAIVPIPPPRGWPAPGRGLYTFRFLKTRDVEVQRIGEDGVAGASASMKPLGSLARVNGFSAHLVGATEKDKVTAVTEWLKKRYRGVTLPTVATVAELEKNVSAQIGAGASDRQWYETNYGIQILTDVEARKWLDEGLGMRATEDLQDLLSFERDELFLLEYVLERMSDGIVSRFNGVRLTRQKVFFEFKKGVFTRRDRVAGTTRGGRTTQTITLFDAATDNPDALFMGGIGPDGKPATMAASAMPFAHELGHVVMNLEPTEKAKFDRLVAGRTINLTWYAASDPTKELFPEAFALFYGDPEWLKNNWPDLFAFFDALTRSPRCREPSRQDRSGDRSAAASLGEAHERRRRNAVHERALGRRALPAGVVPAHALGPRRERAGVAGTRPASRPRRRGARTGSGPRVVRPRRARDASRARSSTGRLDGALRAGARAPLHVGRRRRARAAGRPRAARSAGRARRRGALRRGGGGVGRGRRAALGGAAAD